MHKRFGERPPRHVAAQRQAEQREHRWGDVEQARAVDRGVGLDAGAGHAEHAERAVLGRRAGGHVGEDERAEMVRVEAVVGQQDDGAAVAGQLDEPLQHLVVKPVARLNDALVPREVFVPDGGELRRMVPHKAVPETVDGVEIDGRQVPLRLAHEVRRGGLDGRRVGDDAGERGEPPVVRLVDAGGVGDEREQVRRREFAGVDAQAGQALGQLGRMDCAGRHRPRLAARVLRPLVEVAHHCPIDRLGRMARPPPDDVRPSALLVEHIPERLHLAARAQHRAHALLLGVGLYKSQNAVLVGRFARRHAGPEHRGKWGVQRGEVAHRAALDEPAQRGHLAGVHQRMQHLPVGGVPADEEHFLGNRVRHLVAPRQGEWAPATPAVEKTCSSGAGGCASSASARRRLARRATHPGPGRRRPAARASLRAERAAGVGEKRAWSAGPRWE